MAERRKKESFSISSVRAFWERLIEQGYEPGSYETFLRWVRKVEEEAVRRGYLGVRRGRGKKRYIIKNPEALLRLMCENGFAY